MRTFRAPRAFPGLFLRRHGAQAHVRLEDLEQLLGTCRFAVGFDPIVNDLRDDAGTSRLAAATELTTVRRAAAGDA